MRRGVAAGLLAVMVVWLTLAAVGCNESQATKERVELSSATRQQIESNGTTSARPPAPCTNAEYLAILNKISLNVDIVKDLQRNGSSTTQQKTKSQQQQQQQQQIRPECVRQLIQMIKNLASGELEMKALLEFASSGSQVNLRSDLSYLRASYASERERDAEARRRHEQQLALEAESRREQDYYLLGDGPSAQAAELDKAHFLPKLVASIDQWLDTIERFTLTREWAALLRVTNGAESILSLFANSSRPTAPAVAAGKPSKGQVGQLASIQKASGLSSELLDALERELPGQVQTLTSSLNQLFPWHVWPWNNIDLYSTIDTFLNHGIFAFSKTTAGPERRIDYLPQMLETLFKSLKQDAFPKKCNDWSRIICDQELFYERLALAPPAEIGVEAPDELAKRKQQLKELMGDNKSKLTQELVCIMFSSLSMQQFGARDVDLKSFERELDGEQPAASFEPAPPASQLKWKRQIRKALKLYKLSREALTDEQWAALYRQLNELWNQMKISDRVIMVGRIVQLLTNCHMPREILESALWKDIYKYKNALNQISDIVTEELNRSSESGKFTIEQLAIGSKHLEDILTRFIRLLPRLIESLSLTTTDQLPELVSKFFEEKIAFFKGPCKGHSFSELVPSLSKYRPEIEALERLVCQQLRTKPSIVMSQINNLTNEFLAMALNFTTLSGSLQSLPRFWTGPQMATAPTETPARPLGASIQAVSAAGAALVASTKQNLGTLMSSANGTQEGVTALTATNDAHLARREDATFAEADPAKRTSGANETSIIDELAANPRLAQIVAILQSSALDPPEVHAELPELDWVEAGTSVALLYETIQKLLSFEGVFVIFPEVAEFQEEMRARLESSKRMFTKFGKKDPANLVAYSLDTLMPVALRTFQPLDSFHSECLATFRDIFGETESLLDSSLVASSGLVAHAGAGQPAAPAPSKESRQWQCAVSATNFASFALNNLIGTFNSMLRDILNQMSRQRDLYKFKQAPVVASEQLLGSNSSSSSSSSNSTRGDSSAAANATCVLFDGSITTLMDNLPQLLDLSLETILIASTTTKQRLSLKEAMCSFENTLDPLGEQQQLQRQFRLREAVCHLLHESSLSTCADALRVDLWTSTMRELNSTWFELAAISVEPSFRAILRGVHEFLELFGKVKPSSMSDGLIARILNFNSYWTGLMNKAVSSLDNYRERRFQLALQILMPIIYDNLPVYNEGTNSTMEETKLALKSSILSARAILTYLTRVENGADGGAHDSSAKLQSQVDQQLRTLFEWADQNSVAIGETLFRTLAHNLTKLERLFNSTGQAANSANQSWTRFCLAPIDAYLEFEGAPPALENKASLPAQTRLAEMSAAKEAICKFEWSLLQSRLFEQANLSAISTSSANSVATSHQNASSTSIDQYSTRQLIRVSLTKWGQVLDLVSAAVSSGGSASALRKTAPLPKFLSLSHWQPLREKLPQLTPSSYDPTNFIWIWQAFERLVNTIDQANRNHYSVAPEAPAPAPASNATAVTATQSLSSSAEALTKIFDQFNCALDVVKGGITWDNMVNIYQDRQDVLAAYATLNNGIALASASANTFLAHKKFQKFLNSFVKPRAGLSAFCDMRDKSRLETIFLSPAAGTLAGQERNDEELANAIESFQEFVCDTNLETFVQNLNPISICYQQQVPTSSLAPSQKVLGANSTEAPSPTAVVEQRQPGQLADTIDRFFKLASLAALDAKLVDTNVAKPPIFDRSQWDQLRAWWFNQTEVHQGNSGLALTLVRLFQTLDSINSEHVVWRAIFRSVHELSEVSAYLMRAAEMERQTSLEQRERGQPTKLALIREAAAEVDSAFKEGAKNGSNQAGLRLGHKQQQQLASTMANVMFPEVSNFISLKTFKQLRYIKSISDYFAHAPGAQESLCKNLTTQGTSASKKSASVNGTTSAEGPTEEGLLESGEGAAKRSKFELIDYKLNTSKRLYSLLCHYHSSQWLTAMNIVLSGKTGSLSKKVNYMTKYLLIFTKNFQHNENLQSFIHGQQLENIEAVANTTVSQLVALTQPFRTLTLSKISNISWHSIPNLLDSIDRHLCASKSDLQQAPSGSDASAGSAAGQHQQAAFQLAVYEPKKPDIETLICKLPSWNITQVYNYISENIDLQNMISLATQNNHTASLFGLASSPATNRSLSTATPGKQAPRTCITPFKFASRWLKIAQDLIDEAMSKSSRDKIRKCLNSSKKGQSVYVQTLRYVKILNSLLSTINDLTINNSWPIVRRTWSSISYAILNQSGQLQQALPASHTATLAAPPPQVTPVAPLF